ncbi:centromere/kinetochore protein zw10 homolog [Coccinella septempunctata]|uniref:centromere/kinetochore protein zw10 homolog n=1 Tax=Coccinella septempunctata TaxID=41139 RepID=UPI001D06C460|nr:centromere/kinetochore protein zw10 homolog [Coccinella septempunctata]
MNYISNLLHIKEIYDLDDLNNEVPKLNESLDMCMEEISSTLENVQEEMNQTCERSKSHINNVKEIETELSSLEQSLGDILLEELKSAEESFNGLVEEVDEITTSISLVHVVCEIHERLEMLQDFCKNPTDYMSIVELINVLNMLIETLPHSPIIPFVASLREMVNKEKKNANAVLKAEFLKSCTFVKEKNINKMKVPGKNLKILHSIVPAIYKNESTRELVTTLPNLIWENLFLPLITCQCEVTEVQTDDFSAIQVTIKNDKERNPHEKVYQNVSTMMDYLDKFLDCIIEDDLKLLNFIGAFLKERLSKAILKECVTKEIPRDWKDLPQFKENLMKSTQIFEDKLKSHGFLDRHWEWVDNIEEIYAQTKCQYFTDKSKQLMRKDLHNMIEVGTAYDSSKALMETDEILHCSISSYIPELIKLGHELIDEICEGPEGNCEILFSTYKGIFFNYGDFVASHHQKLLETIPQQVALFYNNCMYLHKQLQKWDQMFETNNVLTSYCDDSSKGFYQVEEVGRMFFDSFVREQKEQIEIILKGTNLHNKKTLETLEDNTEKLIRQCLRQQELLKTVWSKVLSYPVYNQTIGDILNTMCNFLINSLVVLEDIGAVVAENLIELFKIVLNRGVKLFSDSNEVFLYVSLWHKFNELIFVLGASLLDISDRWADGKGPLALHFTPYELKQLIRALFQNSDRRAAVLSRIHE